MRATLDTLGGGRLVAARCITGGACTSARTTVSHTHTSHMSQRVRIPRARRFTFCMQAITTNPPRLTTLDDRNNNNNKNSSNNICQFRGPALTYACNNWTPPITP